MTAGPTLTNPHGCTFGSLPALDAILQAHRHALGTDYDAYRNHTHRLGERTDGVVSRKTVF